MTELRNSRFHLILVYVICTAFAAFLWLLIMLGKTYTEEFSFPVRFTDFPANRLPESKLPEEITVEIQGQGFALLRMTASKNRKPLVVSIGNISGSSVFRMTGNDLKERISSQINPALSIVSVSPQRIDINLAKAVTRKVPVVAEYEINTKKQYILTKKTEPDPGIVTISGAESVIDTIKSITAGPLVMNDVWHNSVQTLSLSVPENVTVTPAQITLSIEVEQAT